jgi:ABC-type transporter Mla maintaining outer membrane lipid asymmetry ATPase subunit MlaF
LSDARSRAPALEVAELSGPVGAPVLHDISFAVPHGATHVVLGPIHSGKTMLLRHLLGLEQATRGTIVVDGERFDARGESEDRLRRMRTRLGVVFQGSALLTRVSAVENVQLPILEHTDASEEEAREAARELLAGTGLVVDDETMPLQLDRAAQRRVAVARALALRPAALLLDEPTIGLDSHASARFDRMLLDLQDREGFGMLLLSHESRHAWGRVNQVYLMSRGTIVARGTREELMTHPHEVARQLLNRRSR